MTTSIIDASAIRGRETTVVHANADGSVWASNPLNPLIVPLPLAASGVITAINVYIKGSGPATLTLTLSLHDAAANTVTVQGTPDTVTVTAASIKAMTVPGTFTPAAHQVATVSILGTNANARIANIEYVF